MKQEFIGKLFVPVITFYLIYSTFIRRRKNGVCRVCIGAMGTKICKKNLLFFQENINTTDE